MGESICVLDFLFLGLARGASIPGGGWACPVGDGTGSGVDVVSVTSEGSSRGHL